MASKLRSLLSGHLSKLASDPERVPGLRDFCELYATVESELTDQARERAELLDLDKPEPVDVERRTEELMDLAGAMFADEVVDHYLREHTDVSEPERARQYLGLPAEEWGGQITAWASSYRSQDMVPDGMTDRAVAARHVESVFGVDLRTFERQVVEVDEPTAMREPIQGRFDRIHTAGEHELEVLREHFNED